MNSVAFDLKDVDRHAFSAGFLKSSAKITIVPKPLKRASFHSRAVSSVSTPTRNGSASPAARDGAFRPPAEAVSISTATWICTICSFSNPVPSNFDPAAANAHTPLAPCLACGIKPSLTHVLKAAISNANSQSSSTPTAATASPIPFRANHLGSIPSSEPHSPSPLSTSTPRQGFSVLDEGEASFTCPRCTFSTHPSLLTCEMCGGPLLSRLTTPSTPSDLTAVNRPQSPGPVLEQTSRYNAAGVDVSESVKLSFRRGGEKIFYERLKGSMTQRKWLLQDAPPAPKGSRGDEGDNATSTSSPNSKAKTAGIAGLEQLGLSVRKNNEVLIGSAFEDLEALMASAKDVIALAERFARQTKGSGGSFSAEENAILAESATQLGLITTKDIVGAGGSESLYLSELSRNLAEFLTDDSRGVLKRAGGIMTLVDLWAIFNRARGGVELVSPTDFEKAARLWEQLKLPIRLRTFRSGVMVVQGRDRIDETTIRVLLDWLQDLHEFPPDREVAWDWRLFGMGVTAHEAAQRFGWSLGVAEEELFMAEEHGAVCREEGLEGLKFWINYIDTGDVEPPKS